MAVPHNGGIPGALPPQDATVADLTADSVTAGVGTFTTLTGYQTEVAHTLALHTGLGLATGGDIPTAISNHEALADPHAGYELESAHALDLAGKTDKTGGLRETVQVIAASGTAQTLNLASANVFDVTLTGNCTLTLSGATNGVACTMRVVLRQDATGGRTVTWPASVAWPDGSTPVLATGANEVDSIWLFTLDGGTTWFGEQRGYASPSAPTLGAWTSYTPSWTAATTAPTLGNGTLAGRYKRLDATTYAIQVYLVYGSTSTPGSGTWFFSLPAGLTSPASRYQVLAAHLLDDGTDHKAGVAVIEQSQTKFYVVPEGANTAGADFPMTWAVNDKITVNGIIEVA